MLPGDGRGPPPGRGAPGRGCGRGMGRSTGCCEEKGLLPTRGARGAGFGAPDAGPGRGPGVAPGVGRGPGVAPGVGAAGALGAAAAGALGAAGGCGAAGLGAAGRAGATGAASAAGACGAGACGAGACGAGAAGLAGAGLGAPGLGAVDAAPPCERGLSSGFLPPALVPNDSRNRRATGGSTVEDADLTNSPCSLSLAKSSLLVTPSSFANSCTRALPAATTSPRLEATAVVGAAPRV